MKHYAQGIYVASKAHHHALWRQYRQQGFPIISTWIDEGEVGETHDFTDLWSRCVEEASQASATVVYRSNETEVLKGALVEIGAALANGRRVYGVGNFDGTYVNHPHFIICGSLSEAFKWALCDCERAQ